MRKMLNCNEKYIVMVGNEYLVSHPYLGSTFQRFSNSPYDGYPFDDFNIAYRFAHILGGAVMKHNRITGELDGGWK
jgi:hypothetical protein